MFLSSERDVLEPAPLDDVGPLSLLTFRDGSLPARDMDLVATLRREGEKAERLRARGAKPGLPQRNRLGTRKKLLEHRIRVESTLRDTLAQQAKQVCQTID